MPTLTIFTPAYNRAYILPELYNSLCRQSSKDFEWLIIDDGSTDNTQELIKRIINDTTINVRAERQTNKGKHLAINKGVEIAKGKLFMIVDSDDRLTPDAVEWIINTAKPILRDSDFAGISGIRITPEGSKIGGGNDFGVIDTNALDIRFKYKIKGDLAEVFKTEVLRKYPFPAFNNEKFCPEALVWNRIAKKFKLRYCHKGIYVCKYLPDGLTAKITKLRRNSPRASMTFYSELAHMSIPFLQKIKASINFWRFSLSDYRNEYNMINSISCFTFFPGYLLKYRDSKKS